MLTLLLLSMIGNLIATNIFPTHIAQIRTYRKALISLILAVYLFYQIIFIPFEFFITPVTKRLRKSANFISSSYGYGLVFVVLAAATQPNIVNVIVGFGMLLAMIIMTIGQVTKLKALIIIFNILGQACGLFLAFDVITSGWVQI